MHMHKAGLLPKTFRLVCIGRREFSAKSFLELVAKKSEIKLTQKDLGAFVRLAEYFQGDLEKPQSFAPLVKVLEDRLVAKKQKQKQHLCYNRLYYFATAPKYFGPAAAILKKSGLLIGCQEHKRTIRVLVEKPFGTNLRSAKALNRQLLHFFTEQQIYRIDHYLGKETVQNILVVRFANEIFEPIWNRHFVDHIEISVFEELGAGERAGFYDNTGALKDFVQNHMLQMLALVCMDKPKTLDTEAIRNEKVKVLGSLVPFSLKPRGMRLVRGQYTKSKLYPGYVDELGKKSGTETYVALMVQLKHERWKGVPVYLRTGKRMPKKLTEISIHLKKQATNLFSNRNGNVISFRIQPDERVRIQVNNKIPGFGMNLHTGSLDFGYKMAFNTELPGAYERLLLDFIQGDQRLFIRSDEIEASWKFIDSITKQWNSKNTPLYYYPAGSFGPEQAEEIPGQHGREWWTH